MYQAHHLNSTLTNQINPNPTTTNHETTPSLPLSTSPTNPLPSIPHHPTPHLPTPHPQSHLSTPSPPQSHGHGQHARRQPRRRRTIPPRTMVLRNAHLHPPLDDRHSRDLHPRAVPDRDALPALLQLSGRVCEEPGTLSAWCWHLRRNRRLTMRCCLVASIGD